VRFAPYLLDPSTPLEGKPRKQMTAPGDPPSAMESRAESLGITFTRGRQWTSNSLLAHEASEHVTEHETPEIAWAFHRAMFKAYFTDLEDVAQKDLLLRVAAESGVAVEPLREALEDRRYQEQVLDALNWARQIGVTGVPTFVVDEKYGVVGAQDLAVFQGMMEHLGKRRIDGTSGPKAGEG
jgi:predicted DsbA family dithiol-disulfide isomerase